MGTMLRFAVLGPLEVTAWGARVPLGGAKQRALLAILLLNANESLSTDRLIDLLWGQRPPESAANALQVYVSGLRKALEPDRPRGDPPRILVSGPSGYVLRVEPEQLDSVRFERLVDDARAASSTGRHDAAAFALRRALALWRGPALADFAYEPFAQSERNRLEELRMAALEERIEADLALGRHGELIGELDALIEQDPLRERVHGFKMLALYRSGRQAEALDAYRRARRVLQEELGVEPSTGLKALERHILVQDPSLDLAPRQTEASPWSPKAPRSGVGRERRRQRKVVTTLSCEVAAAAPSGTALDPEALGAVVGDVFEKVGAAVERHGGTVQSSTGDRITAVFGIPQVREDDALRAVRAAAEVTEAVAQTSDGGSPRPEISVGINTGEVVTGVAAGVGGLPAGSAVNLATELGLSADRGDVLLGENTYQLVRDALEAEPIRLRSARPPTRALHAWRLVKLTPAAEGRLRRFDAPMVGRERERALLREAFERVAAEGSCYLLTILGGAGIGKSRLIAEAIADFGADARVLRTRCLPYGDDVALWPLAQLVRQSAALGDRRESRVSAAIATLLEDVLDGDRAAEVLAQLVGRTAEPGVAEETSWAVRKLLEALARRRPVVVIVDDVHWADASLLEVIEHVSEWARAGILLVCLGRPDFLERHPHWGGGRANASAIVLEPLDPMESRDVVCNLLGSRQLPPVAVDRIVETAQGNPLFVEEVLAMLIEGGVVGWEADRWKVGAEFTRMSIPPTIQALIGARIDALGREERQVLERAAVVGESFSPAPLIELSPPAVAPQVETLVHALMRKDLVFPAEELPAGARSGRGDDPAFRFRHNLVRDVVYDAIPKHRRAELHQGFASWLERTSEWVSGETVGFHLEQACLLRRELGEFSDELRELEQRAASRLAEAGHQARLRGDLTRAIGLMGRATKLWPRDAPGRLLSLIALSACYMDSGDMQTADELLTEAVDEAGRLGDRRLQARAAVTLWEARSSTHNVAGWRDEALREASDAIAVFTELHDELGLALAHRLRAMVHQNDYRFAQADIALQQALAHARRAADEHEERAVLEWYAHSSMWGPASVDEAIVRHDHLRRRFGENLLVEATCLRRHAVLAAMQGRFPDARRLLARSRAILDDLGSGVVAALTVAPGVIELLAGDPMAAEREFRTSYEALEQLGESNARVLSASYLARALYDQGRYDEADGFARIAEELTPEDDLAARIEWAPVRSKLLARRGRVAEAVSMAREAVAVAERTDDISAHATALVDLADVLEMAGEDSDVKPALEKAVELYERKGNIVQAQRAKARL